MKPLTNHAGIDRVVGSKSEQVRPGNHVPSLTLSHLVTPINSHAHYEFLSNTCFLLVYIYRYYSTQESRPSVQVFKSSSTTKIQLFLYVTYNTKWIDKKNIVLIESIQKIIECIKMLQSFKLPSCLLKHLVAYSRTTELRTPWETSVHKSETSVTLKSSISPQIQCCSLQFS